MGEDHEEPYACPVCDVAFADEDMVSFDVDLGSCHAECLEGAPIVDIDTGEPMPAGTKVLTVKYGVLARPDNG